MEQDAFEAAIANAIHDALEGSRLARMTLLLKFVVDRFGEEGRDALFDGLALIGMMREWRKEF